MSQESDSTETASVAGLSESKYRELASVAGLSESEYRELLEVERRKVTLDVLAGRTAPVGLEDLAATVAIRETTGGAGKEATERVACALHHIHLPKLAALGLVDYDQDANRIESCHPRLSG